MTVEEYDKLKPCDIVIEASTGKEWKFVKEHFEILKPIEYDSVYSSARLCEKYVIIEDTNNRTYITLNNFINDFKIENSMENEIKIKVPEGKKAVQNVDSNGNIVIKFQNIESIRSKSWEEFCKNHPNIDDEYYINSNGLVVNITGSTRNREATTDKNLLETIKDVEGLLALIQLTRLHDEWVGDWEPDLKSFEYKHVILHDNDDYVVRCAVNYHRLLMFPTSEMAKEFMGCFKDLLDKAKKFI